MKKILFLSYAYPYGHYGPSDNCTVRIMDELSHTEGFEVYNISGLPKNANSKPTYKVIDNLQLLQLPFPEKQVDHSYLIEHLLLFLKIPIYPIVYPWRIWTYYRACKKILNNYKFDLVIAQCAPHESVITGALLKKNGYVEKLMVIYWDNIYGKTPHSIIPKNFAKRRRRALENWIARYADKIISPIPVKSFHDQYGDVNEARNKRVYLGHPSISRPQIVESSLTQDFIQKDKINILYAGRLYDMEDISYSINLLNSTSIADRINLIFFFYKKPSEIEMSKMSQGFKGRVKFSGCVPFEELIALYSSIDIFLGYAGVDASQVISKIYDYMCFGKPIIYFYKDDNDVNVEEFAHYPLFRSINVLYPNSDNAFGEFINKAIDQRVAFDDVERLFPSATTSAYVNVINNVLNQ